MAVIARDAQRGRIARTLRALSWSLVIAPLTIVCIALATIFTAELLYADRALPGLTVGGVNVGSLDRAATLEHLQAEVSRPWLESTVIATYDGRVWRTSNAALGVHPDVVAARDAALAYGKTGPLLDRLAAWADALRGDAAIPLTFVADGTALEAWVTGVAADVDRGSVSGALSVGPNGVAATYPVVGRQLDRAATASSVLAAQSLGDREIALSVRAVYPAVDESGFAEAFAKAQAATTPLIVRVEDRFATEDIAGLSSLLRVERIAAKPGELAPLPAGAIVPATRYRYTVTLDDARVGAWASALAARLDRPATNAKYIVNADHVVSVVPGVTGIRLEQEKMRALVQAQLFTPASAVREIVAPSAAEAAGFTTSEAKDWLPKMTRTSSFTTYFPVSKSRHANIATGASQFDGVVIMPGQTFSFWQLLGPVTVERGYAYAGAIIENRSDENVIGGGLCQVSTTMFNAVAPLGYDIVERHAHGYLIERYPMGLDAAVFDPGVDFKWRNDTASPVFVWSWVGDTFVTFDVYGLPTGRTVTFSDPSQMRFIDVPADQAADPAFPKGYSVRGRDVYRTRTVMEGGKVLYQDVFFSHYAPVWGGLPAEGQTAIVR